VTMVSEVRWIGVNQIQHDSSVDYRWNFVFSTFSPDNLNVWWIPRLDGLLPWSGTSLIAVARRQ